jgi:hypothetical protein
MTTTSAAPTLGDSWNRQLADNTGSMAVEPIYQGMRFSPPSLATLDLPRGKVLMVVDAIPALDLQRLLHEAGYRVVGPATSVAEIQRMIERGDIDCVVLDFEVDRRAPLPIADLLAFADVPFVYLTTGVSAPLPVWHRHRPVVERPFRRDALLAAVEKAMAKPRKGANDNHWHGGLVVPWTRVYPPL